MKCLEREGVDTIFAYPGGASMEFHQALTRSKQIRVILPRHEQGGVFAAEGYARASGKVGVCMTTSGPGATNLVTGIADAYMDSTPLVAITGQVPQALIGRNAFQEIDIFGITLPIVKHSYLVTDVNDIPRTVKQAFYLARTGRPGPVLIDVPKNIQQTRTQPLFPKEISVRGYAPHPSRQDRLEPPSRSCATPSPSRRPPHRTITGTGISCGTGGVDCTEIYDYGTAVPLTPTPDANYNLGGWTGACSGTGTCSVTMTAARTVGATFTIQRYTLTVTAPANGTITATGITCGTGGVDCTEIYDYGTVVPLTATPATGYDFGGWTPAASTAAPARAP